MKNLFCIQNLQTKLGSKNILDPVYAVQFCNKTVTVLIVTVTIFRKPEKYTLQKDSSVFEMSDVAC